MRPRSQRRNPVSQITGKALQLLLLLLGLVLYAITLLLNRRLGVKKAALDPSKLDG